MKPHAWNTDAFREYSEVTENYLLLNKPIREFLNRDEKFLLVGAKGLGKTLFLRYKSYRFHKKYGDKIKFHIAQNELTENLEINSDTLSKESLLGFSEQWLWQRIWELTLWTVVFRIFEQPIHPRLEKIVGDTDQISVILSHLLNNRGQIDEYSEFVNDFLTRKGLIQSGVAIFVDDVDQALRNSLLAPHYTDYVEKGQSLSAEVWVNAQMGLVGAIYNINRKNTHVKIYATIRREAFEAYSGEMKMNYMQHISLLHYDKSEIKAIFEKNIQLLDPGPLFLDGNASWIAQFLGFDHLQHRFAEDLQGRRRVESAFDFIYRHTYGRPREIVLMGQAIDYIVSAASYVDADEKERMEKVRAEVNKVSNDLLKQYKEEIIPYVNEEKFQEFIKKVRSNVITKENVAPLDNGGVFRQMFQLGLVGHVRAADQEGRLKQVFNPPATYNYRQALSLPETSYFVIHSTLDASLIEQHSYGYFYNRNNIIGDGYDFFPNVVNQIYPVEHYIPDEIVGIRMDANNEAAGHEFPLRAIYDSFFDFQDSTKRHEKFIANIDVATSVLGLLGRICYCHRLAKKFGTEVYQEKKQEYFDELDHYHFLREYNARIPDAHSEQAHDRFLDRLVGRFITLGCYLALDIRVEWIHQLLRKGVFTFVESDSQTAFSYLSRSFFIRGLSQDEPRNPKNHQHRQQKQRIFNWLSPWEQEHLRQFIQNACDEVHFLDWIDKGEHREWVINEIFPKIWRPE